MEDFSKRIMEFIELIKIQTQQQIHLLENVQAEQLKQSLKQAELQQTVKEQLLQHKLLQEQIISQQKANKQEKVLLQKHFDEKFLELQKNIAHIKNIRRGTQNFSPSKESLPRKTVNYSPKKRNETDNLPPTPCTGCGHLHWYKDCLYRNKKCLNCDRIGHKASHCRKKNSDRYIKTVRSDVQDGRNSRKYVRVNMLNRNVNFQLDTGSDLNILNKHTWSKLKRPTMLRTSKVARSITGEKLNLLGEIVTNVTLEGRTQKLRLFVMKNTDNLFGTDAIQKFRFWRFPINCQNRKQLSAEKKGFLHTTVQRTPTRNQKNEKDFRNSSNRTEIKQKNGTCSSSAKKQNKTIYKKPKSSQSYTGSKTKDPCILPKMNDGRLHQNIALDTRQQRFWTKVNNSVPSLNEELIGRYRPQYFSIFPHSKFKTAHFYSSKQLHPD